MIFPSVCQPGRLENKFLDPEDFKAMSFKTTGKLGLKGTSVALYSGQKNGGRCSTGNRRLKIWNRYSLSSPNGHMPKRTRLYLSPP